MPKPHLSNIYVEYSPVVPVSGLTPSDLIDFKVVPLDYSNVGRLTDNIEIWIADNQDLISHVAPTSPAKTCKNANQCQLLDVVNLTGTPGQFAYKAVAYDTTGGRVETSWRMVTIPSIVALTLNLVATPLMAGVNSNPFGHPAH